MFKPTIRSLFCTFRLSYTPLGEGAEIRLSYTPRGEGAEISRSRITPGRRLLKEFKEWDVPRPNDYARFGEQLIGLSTGVQQRSGYRAPDEDILHSVRLVVPPLLPPPSQTEHEGHSAAIVDPEAQPQNVGRPSTFKHVLHSLPVPVLIYIAATIISLALALWWTILHSDISGGFTMGAYVWGIIVFPAGYWHWSSLKPRAREHDNIGYQPLTLGVNNTDTRDDRESDAASISWRGIHVSPILHDENGNAVSFIT